MWFPGGGEFLRAGCGDAGGARVTLQVGCPLGSGMVLERRAPETCAARYDVNHVWGDGARSNTHGAQSCRTYSGGCGDDCLLPVMGTNEGQ